MSIDQIEEIKEKLDDLRADQEEKNQFFIDAANSADNDDLLEELNELEALQAAEELENVEIGTGRIEAKGGAAQIHVQAGKSEEDELDELKMMMAWEAWVCMSDRTHKKHLDIVINHHSACIHFTNA